MKNNILYYTLAILIGFVSCKGETDKATAQNESPEKQARPNIIFILADDLGFADLNFAGSDTHLTPNLDKLAKESVYFNNAYSAHPTCLPSRLAIMTGKYPARLGAVSHGVLGGVTSGDNSLPMKEVGLGQALKDGGYTTAHIGKWHIGSEGNNPPERGFDVDIASNDFCCPGSYLYPFESSNEKQKKASKVPDLEDRKEGDYLTDALGDEAAKYIKSTGEQPFFLNMSFYAVHTPIMATPEKIAKYKKLMGPDARHNNPTYASMVEHLDDAVGTIINALEEKGIADNTIIIFTSDNGGEVQFGITDNYPLQQGKGSSYEGGTRVPLLVKWPGVTQANTVRTEPIIGFDYYPTILSMANTEGDAEHNKGVDGVDFTSILKDPNTQLADRDLHWLKYLSMVHFKIPIVDNKRCVETVISGDWKLHEFFPMPDGYTGHFELYNIKEDPSEAKNLAEKNPDKVKELKTKMEYWKKETNALPYDMEAFYGHVKI